MTHPYYLKTVENGYTPEAEKAYKEIADMQTTNNELLLLLRQAYDAMADTNKRNGCTAYPLQYKAMEAISDILTKAKGDAP